jgi:hypothetical protein
VRLSNQISSSISWSAQWHTPLLSQVLDLLLAFPYAYLTYNQISSSISRLSMAHASSYHRFGPALSVTSERLPYILLGLAWHSCNVRAARWRARGRNAGEQSTAPGFPSRRCETSPGAPWQFISSLDQSAAPTSDQRQVLDEDSPFNFELESGDGDAPLHTTPGGSQTVRSATTGSAAGASASTFRMDVMHRGGKSSTLFWSQHSHGKSFPWRVLEELSAPCENRMQRIENHLSPQRER